MRWLLVLCLAASTTRADGFYFTEGLGVTNVHDELSAHMQHASRFRVSLGMRSGPWAVEGWFAAVLNDSLWSEQPAGPPDLLTRGIDVKYLNPLSKHLEIYLRGSASYAEASGELAGYHGRGLGVGAGIQLAGKVSPWGLVWAPLFFLVRSGPMIRGALWLDTGYEFYRLHAPTPGQVSAIDAQLSHVTLGFGLGSDF